MNVNSLEEYNNLKKEAVNHLREIVEQVLQQENIPFANKVDSSFQFTIYDSYYRYLVGRISKDYLEENIKKQIKNFSIASYAVLLIQESGDVDRPIELLVNIMGAEK